MVQLPLFIIFSIVSEYHIIKVLFTLLAVIFLTAIPINFIVAFRIIGDGSAVWMVAGLASAYALVYLIVFKLARPRYLNMLKYAELSTFKTFMLIPILYYVYTYSVSSYDFTKTVSLYDLLIGLIPEIIIFLSYFLYMDIFNQSYKLALEKEKNAAMQLQQNAAVKEISLLETAQRDEAIYRHDMRHHLNYINACIQTGKLSEAADYIKTLSERLNSFQMSRQYCGNNALNLILSSFADEAEKVEVTMKFNIKAVDFSRFHDIDLCILFSNALENSLKACSPQEEDRRYVVLDAYEKGGKLCIFIANGCSPALYLKQAAGSEALGTGTLSMMAIVEKYDGICEFSAENGQFIFQATM